MIGSRNRWALSSIACVMLLAGCSQETADWKQASAANTIEAYQLFLKQHPRAAEATQAQTHIAQLGEQRDWQIAVAANTRDSYQQFLTQHPSGQWTQEARIRVENFAQAGVSGGVPPPGQGSPAAANELAATASAAPAPGAPAADTAQPGSHLVARHGTASREHRASRAHSARLASASAHTRTARTVQLGAYRSRAGAQLAWKRLAARFAGLRGLQPRYVAVRSRGEHLYRLQVRLASPAAASGLCATLRHHAHSCVRVDA